MTSPSVPPYVPPHLSGRVSDFRQEEDGQVSFADPQRALGLGPDQSRKKISLDQFKQTFDPRHRAANMEQSLTSQYDSPLARPTSTALELRDKLVQALQGGMEWGTANQRRSVGTAGLLSGLLGAGAGAWQASRSGGSPWARGALYALLAGGAGAAGTAYLHNTHNKREAQMKSASVAEDMIIQALSRDTGLTKEERTTLFRLVRDLRAQDADKLSSIVKGIAGAGVGVAVARFLKLNGLLPQVAGGILGAVLASRKTPKRNALGQLSL